MYNQKFNPYGGFPSKSSQLYEEEYEEEESQPLVEQVDDSYEPTDKEVREYAVETLGMRFPEDEGLLYLAREGLKAPLPDNWVPYQGRDGEVYYKHRITQEKTYDHPTDLEYRKKYEQQKEKMARKNLKSMNMKASAAPNALGPNASSLFGSKMASSNMFTANALSSASDSLPPARLDPRIEQEYEEELENYDERLKREWREFEIEERQRSENRIKKLKQDYDAEIDRIYSGKQKEVRLEDKLKAEKEGIRQRLEEQLEAELRDELRDYERQCDHNNREFSGVYEEDMHLKLAKHQQEKDHEFQQRQDRLEDMVARLAREREAKKKDIEETLKRLRSQFENGQNGEIEAATAEALDQELHSIRASYAQKLKEKEGELERQYLETKRILGFDQNAYLSELASKKGRIKGISQQKVESFKKKEMQSFTIKSQNDLEQAQTDLKDRLTSEFAAQLQQERERQEQRLGREKERLDREARQRSEASIENIYEQMKTKIRVFQTEMNKKLSTVQDRFISDIHGKSRGQSRELAYRIDIKEREMAVENKSMLIASLRRQAELERVTLHLMRLQSDIYQCADDHQVDERLLKLANEHGLEYRPDKFLRFEQRYRELKDKCRKDKEFLASVMGSLQDYRGASGVGSQALLKQYNQDVRAMRDNEEMLRKLEGLLRRAELNDRAALEELGREELEYREVELKREMVRAGSQVEELPVAASRAPQPLSRTRDVESALKDHSKFLSNMRSELNRKLYQIRCGTYY